MTDEGTHALIYAIVERAAKDYRMAKRRLAKKPSNYSAQNTLYEVKSFFLSDWFFFLSGMDGQAAIKELENGILSDEDER